MKNLIACQTYADKNHYKVYFENDKDKVCKVITFCKAKDLTKIF